MWPLKDQQRSTYLKSVAQLAHTWHMHIYIYTRMLRAQTHSLLHGGHRSATIHTHECMLDVFMVHVNVYLIAFCVCVYACRRRSQLLFPCHIAMSILYISTHHQTRRLAPSEPPSSINSARCLSHDHVQLYMRLINVHEHHQLMLNVV